MVKTPQFSSLQEFARGRDCDVRLPWLCKGGGDTTVLAHPPTGVTLGKGIGNKPSNLLGSAACHACHDEIDRRTMHLDPDEVELAFWRGHARFLMAAWEAGLISVK